MIDRLCLYLALAQVPVGAVLFVWLLWPLMPYLGTTLIVGAVLLRD